MLITTANRAFVEVDFSLTSFYASIGRQEVFIGFRPLGAPRVSFSKDPSAVYLTLGWVEITYDRKAA